MELNSALTVVHNYNYLVINKNSLVVSFFLCYILIGDIMKFILASGSKQRQDILNSIGLKFEVITSNIDENSNKKEPFDYVMDLSKQKGESVSKNIDYNCIIISSDTIIYKDGKKYEKPKSKEEAYNNLLELSNSVNTAYTGVTIFDKYQNKTITYYDKCDVYFKNINKDEIAWYVDNEEKVFNVCGYSPLGRASIFIDKIDGDYNTLFGISPNSLIKHLYELGYNINDIFGGNYD